MYEVDGYLSAPAYFDVERTTGRVVIRNDFSLDVTTSYRVSSILIFYFILKIPHETLLY